MKETVKGEGEMKDHESGSLGQGRWVEDSDSIMTAEQAMDQYSIWGDRKEEVLG